MFKCIDALVHACKGMPVHHVAVVVQICTPTPCCREHVQA